MTKVLIIGGGFAGCIAAQMLVGKGYDDVTLIEASAELGGSCRTQWYGNHPYTVGPRHFLTRREDVWNFLNSSCPMHRYDAGHEFLTYVERDSAFYHFPIHRDEVAEMPDSSQILEELRTVPGPEGAANLEEYWLFSVGQTLYDKFVNGYSKKMWGIDSNVELTDFGFTPKGVALKSGSKAAWDDAISGFPLAPNGYDDYFSLATKDVKVLLNTLITDFDITNYRVKVDNEWHQYDLIINTISPEVLLKNAYGPLRWMGRDFLKIVLPVEKVFPDDVYFLYYANTEPFTRIVEYKKFYRYKSPHTLIGIEVPSFNNKLYPFPCKKDQAIHRQYIEALPSNVHSIGRNGSYRYLDVGLIIEQCLDLFKNL
ncbi:MAG: UDP-galactopyranose mutase [Phaeospirillum sp.]|nr:UDP-galactopyranose mutase [Phaeospirillum sp.]